MTTGQILRLLVRAERKQREFESREQDILQTALELFSGHQWESVSVEQIALRAGVAKGTVYSHFTSKDGLLFRLYMDFYRGLLTELTQIDKTNDILVDFRKIVDRSFRYHIERNEYRYIVSYCKRIDFRERADSKLQEIFHELDKEFNDWITGLVHTGMDADVFEFREVKQVILGLHACFEGTINMMWAGKQWCIHGDAETVIKLATEFILSGVVGQKLIRE